MSVESIAKRLVELCNAGKAEEAAEELYSPNIVSIEAQGSADMPARIQGMDAVRKKGDWWNTNNTVHSMTAEGPFIGNRPDQFAVKFNLDVTPKGGQRFTMSEVGLYTVAGNKIAQEEFLYLA
jgi:hypothetical protein